MSDTATQAAVGPFPTFKRFFGWLFSWRVIRRCLFAVACLVTLLALFYAEENWRGRRAWNKYRQELEARGEQLDFRAFIPKPLPDDQNLAATPFIKSWFLRENMTAGHKLWQDDYTRVSRSVSASVTEGKGDRHFMDLVAWGMAFDAIRPGAFKQSQEFKSDKLDLVSRARAAPAVLEGLKSSETDLAELRAASQRPYSRYPVVYDLDNPWGILIPHLANVKNACQRLLLKSCAELAVGQSENALADVKLTFSLADSVKDEPFLISYLVRLACFHIATQPIWEGLAEHRWSDAQLQELQTRLQRYDFLTDLKHPLDGERAAGVLTADLLYQKKYRVSELFDLGPPSVNLVSRIAPHGWYYLEQLNYCRLYQLQLEGTFDASQKRVSPSQIESNAHKLEREISGGRLGKGLNAIIHHQVIASMLLPALHKIPMKAAIAQTAADQAALACGLERYRLVNGQFPENLTALVPKFSDKLPHDVITGEPLKYRRTDSGQFVLYSVGWNAKDDGGEVALTKGKRPQQDLTEGDWVWRYPAKE